MCVCLFVCVCVCILKAHASTFICLYRSYVSTVRMYLPFICIYRSYVSTVHMYLPFICIYRSYVSTVHMHLPFASIPACFVNRGARGGAVGWGTALQVGRSWVRFPVVSLEFFIDIILPVALWPWGWLSLYQEMFLVLICVMSTRKCSWYSFVLWVPGIFPGGKGGWCLRLTNLLPSCADCLEIWEPQPRGTF